MIKFFRHIRQQLVSESKFNKYLFYAIGEIVLVVIGILIALQLNKWNENRKLEASEQDILRNLRTELIGNREKLRYMHDRHTLEYKKTLYALSLFGKDISEIPEKKLDSIMGFVESGYTFESNDGYIKSLIASNKIDYIKNITLKAYISSFDAMVLDATQEGTALQRILNERLWPAIDGKLNALNRLASYEEYRDFPSGTYLSDYKWFFTDREMEDLVANIASWKKEVITDEKKLADAIEEMITIIDNELKDENDE